MHNVHECTYPQFKYHLSMKVEPLEISYYMVQTLCTAVHFLCMHNGAPVEHNSIVLGLYQTADFC